jgi:flagellar protein FliO/FliZ
MPVVALMQAAEGAADPAALGPLGLRSFLALAVVGVLLAATVWGLKRVTDARRGRQLLSVESALSLGDKRSLVIVAVEGRRLLVGVAPGGVSLVTELQQPFATTLAASLETPDPS